MTARGDYYEVDGDEITVKKEECPKCDAFLADHGDRKHCGRCGFTEWE